MVAELKSALVRAPRRTWSIEERRRNVDEALSAGASVARVARRHGLNANLVFKWIGRSRKGWLDRRRGPRKGGPGVTLLADDAAPAFVPVQILEARSGAVASPAPMAALPKPDCEDRKSGRRGATENQSAEWHPCVVRL
jgi:transposase